MSVDQPGGGLYFLCIWVDFMWGHLVSDEIQRNLFVPDEMWLRRSGLSRTICQTTNSWKHLNFSKWEDTSICAATLHHQQNTPPWSHRSPWSAIILVHNRVRPGRVYLYVCKKIFMLIIPQCKWVAASSFTLVGSSSSCSKFLKKHCWKFFFSICNYMKYCLRFEMGYLEARLCGIWNEAIFSRICTHHLPPSPTFSS